MVTSTTAGSTGCATRRLEGSTTPARKTTSLICRTSGATFLTGSTAMEGIG